MSKNKQAQKQTEPVAHVAPAAQVAPAAPQTSSVAQDAPQTSSQAESQSSYHIESQAESQTEAQTLSVEYMRLSCDNLHIDINYQQAEWLGADWQNKHILAAMAMRAAYAAFTIGKEQIGDKGQTDPDCQYELGVRLSDDAELCYLNATWRGQNKPTNVLAFATNEWQLLGQTGKTQHIKSDQQIVSPCMLGDIVLARETLIREAQAGGKTRFAHFQHLIVHGVLHLLGYDHVIPQQARIMEKLERHILSDLAILDAKKPLFNKEIAQKTTATFCADGEKPHAPI